MLTVWIHDAPVIVIIAADGFPVRRSAARASISSRLCIKSLHQF